MGESKRFADWEKVDCNDCARYWDSSCDGVKKDAEKPCNSFLATRGVIIPARLNNLEKRVKWLEWAVGVGFIILGVLAIMGG